MRRVRRQRQGRGCDWRVLHGASQRGRFCAATHSFLSAPHSVRPLRHSSQGTLTPALLCCEGTVDDCGTCNGSNACDTLAQYFLPAPRRRLLTTQGNIASALNTPAGSISITSETASDVTFQIASLTSAQRDSYALSLQQPATSNSLIAYALSASAALAYPTPGDISKPLVCGDGVCSPSETPSNTEADGPLTCRADCPFSIGFCPVPGSQDLGDPTLECGGNGSCVKATYTCLCYAFYAGDACQYCAIGSRRNGNICQPEPAARTEVDGTVTLAPAPAALKVQLLPQHTACAPCELLR